MILMNLIGVPGPLKVILLLTVPLAAAIVCYEELVTPQLSGGYATFQRFYWALTYLVGLVLCTSIDLRER